MTLTKSGEQKFIERRASRLRRMPTVFLAHGSPMSVLDKEFGQELRKFFGRFRKIRAIVICSAHWQTSGGVRITSNPQPKLIYDFMGFPGWLYQLTYGCPGDRTIAQAIAILLQREGIDARLDPERGLDHGVWVPLSLAVPEANIPVIQVSLPLPAEPDRLMSMGRALAPLRSEDILLVGSGGLVHNLARVGMDVPDNVVEPWAEEFDRWAYERVSASDTAGLADYRRQAPHATTAVPTSEHYDPLLVTMGSALPNDSVADLYEGFRYGTLSMRSFALVGRRREDRGA
jgi:4,5-DOPA dioxygenase extradiol